MSSFQKSGVHISEENAKSQKGSIEGKIYENLSLALLAKRGYELSKDDKSEFRNFSIGREVDIGKDGKFDDVVFRYKDQDNKNNLIFVQIKYKQGNYQIDSDILSNKMTGERDDGHMRRDFNLQKYFISYLNVREELNIIKAQNESGMGKGREKNLRKDVTPKELRNGKIKYVVIFTNIDLKSDELNDKGFNLKPAPEDIANLFNLRRSSLTTQESKICYQLGNVSEGLCETLKKSSDLHKVARELAQYVVWKNYRENKIMGIDKTPIKHYHVALEKQVIKKSDDVISKSSKDMKNKEYREARFRDEFLINNEAGPEKELRDAIIEAIRELDESQRNTSDDVLKSILKGAKWNVVPNFGSTKKNVEKDLPSKWLTIEDKDITDFLECLVFVVNQPSVKELEVLLSISTQVTVLEDTLFRKVLNKIENSGQEFRKRIEKVFGIFEKANYKEKWTSGYKIKTFIQEQKELIRVTFLATALAVIYEDEIMQYAKFNNYGVMEKLNNFLRSKSNVLCVNTPATLLTSIKILQYLNTKENYRPENGRISISLDILKSKESRDSVLKAFASENNNLLFIECRHAVDDQNLEDLYWELSRIIKGDDDKKIILITKHYQRSIMVEKFRMEFQNKGLYVEENDSIHLKDFEPKEDPLMKDVFVFQEDGERFNLAQLTGIKSWNIYVDCAPQEGFYKKQDIIDITTLDTILTNEEIKIGSKPLGTSSLEGAYASLFEEINTENFANILSSQRFDNNTNDIYVIRGFSGFDQKEKMDQLIQYLGLVSDRDKIENQLGEIGSYNKIQIADHLFKNENFKLLCREYPEKQIFWISVRNGENGAKFILNSFYNPKFYIKRKFKNIIIKDDVKEQLMSKNLSEVFIIHWDNDQEDFSLLANDTEKEQFLNNFKNGKVKLFTVEGKAKTIFEEISKQNESQIVHLLRFEENQIIWCNSNGSVNSLRKYIDEREISLVEEDNLFKEIKDRKAVIFADDPGMGKTATLTKLCESKDGSSPISKTHWVFKISLKDHIQDIRDIELSNNSTDDIVNVVEFLSKVDSKLNNAIAKNLLGIALDKSKNFSKPLLLAFDGFDEVLDEDDRNKIISLLKFLKNKTPAKLWITTRLQHKKTLENALEIFALEFYPMDNEAKVKFVRKYLSDRLRLILSEELFAEIFLRSDELQGNKRIQTYTEAFLNKSHFVFKNNALRFIGTPLQLYLMLEGSVSHFKIWIENDEEEHPNFDYLGNDLWEIYKKFIDRKYDIYHKKVDVKESVRKKQDKSYLNKCNKDFAKSLILKSKPTKTLTKFKDIVLLAGIIISQGSNMEFIHPTFRDYFVAKLFMHWFKNGSTESLDSNQQEYLIKDILSNPDYQLTRTFINVKLETIAEPELLGEIMKQFAIITETLFKSEECPLVDFQTTLSITIFEGNAEIAYFLIKNLEEHKDLLKLSLTRFFVNNNMPAYERNVDEIVRACLDFAAEISKDTLRKFSYIFNDFGTYMMHEAMRGNNVTQISEGVLNRIKTKLSILENEEEWDNVSSVACGSAFDLFDSTVFPLICQQNNSDILRVIIDVMSLASGNTLPEYIVNLKYQ